MCAVAKMPEPTDARFSLRFLLVAMAVVSLFAAIVGAVIQKSSPEVRNRLTVFWGIFLASTMVWITVQLQRRKRAERQAGATILRLPMSGDAFDPYGFSSSSIGRAVLIVITLLLSNVMIAITTSVSGPSDWIFSLGLFLFLSLMAASHFAPLLLWMGEARFCEAGILWDQKVLLWDHMIDYRWKGPDERRLEIFSVDEANTVPWLLIPVAPENRDAVRQVLESRTRSIANPGSAYRVGVGQVPITKVFQKSNLRRHSFAVLASVICGGTLFCIGILGDTGVAEFDKAKYVGFCLWVFLSAFWHWRGQRAGSALVRIFARRDWLGFFATFILALVTYSAASHMIWPAAWIAYAAGLAFWYLVLKTVTYFLATQLDLRANGIVLFGGLHYPWSKLRIVSWDPAQSGRLVFARGWRRIVATVLPEQRDAVSLVLKEKLGYAGA